MFHMNHLSSNHGCLATMQLQDFLPYASYPDFLLLSNHNPIQQTLYLCLHFNNAIMLFDYLKQSGRNHLINYHFIAKFSPMAPSLMAIWFSILNFHTKIPSYVMILHTKLVIFDQNIQNVVSLKVMQLLNL